MTHTPSILAALPPIVVDHLPWWIAGVVIIAGLFIYGLRDTLALLAGGFKRAWAISSVCFAESIRKRVLWIAPVAILGVIVVSQFQRPIDEADAVRQMLKVCLFATGLVVTITAIILACSNLPKEIENRVIYTIVTKPVTRLEIVVGKVVGFARVSAAILLIMGLFTFAYLAFNAWSYQREISARLAGTQLEAAVRPTLEYYRDTGLLTARKLAAPSFVQVIAREPVPGERWLLGGEGDVLIPFDIKESDLIPPDAPTADPLSTGLAVQMRIGYDARFYKHDSPEITGDLPPTVAAPTSKPSGPGAVDAIVSAQLVDRFEEMLVPSSTLDKGQPLRVPDAEGAQPLTVFVEPKVLPEASRWTRMYVNLSAYTPGVDFRLKSDSVRLLIPATNPNLPPREILPAAEVEKWLFRGRLGRIGYQVRGGVKDQEQTHVAVFSFTKSAVSPDSKGNVPVEFRSDVERSGTEDADEKPTQLEVVVRDRVSGKQSAPITSLIEANRPVYLNVPAELMSSGDFDVLARVTTPGHYLSVTSRSTNVVQENQGFALNLFKSLLILWLMAILVIAVSVFCSTFLSWPIAIVLTLVMLLCRWGVMQLGDALQPGIGNQVATDLGFTKDPSISAAVSKSVEALATFLNKTAAVLPDISQFASIEDLERGVAIPPRKVVDSSIVLLTFGVPIIVIAYVFLRNKEVAP